MNKQAIKTVKVSATGVQFGNAWFSHESITSYTADQLNAGTCGVTGGAYMAWLSSEEPAPAYDEAKERELFEAFAISRGWEKRHFKLREDGNYEDWGVNPEWQAWKGCAKSRAGTQS